MKRSPLISVIITNYNYGSYIEECIDSVLGQTYPNIELIVIDDGSTDNSGEIIKKYTKQHPEIIYIHQKNQGANVSRNTGIKTAKGEYIFLLDADNWLNPGHIEELYRTAIKTSADVVYADLQHFGDDNLLHTMPEFDLGYLKISNFVDTASLVRKKAIGKNKFDMWLNRRFLQDYDFFLGLALKGLKFAKCPNASLNYRVHNKQNGGQHTVKKLQQAIENYSYVFNKYRDLYPKEFSPGDILATDLLRDRMLLQKTNLELIHQNDELHNENTNLQHQNAKLINSLSWRITKPARTANRIIQNLGQIITHGKVNR